MFFSEIIEDDGYSESICHLFTETQTPILRARAVLMGNGKFGAVVRDYKSGVMVASNYKDHTKDNALTLAKDLCKLTIMAQIADYQFQVLE